ncbi:acyltransferase [Ottowia caeni]|uniref:acyltransferase n=1 Tax=Ottowia caeni TaxID=2870339 RepID=UPI003D74B1D7
MGLEAIKALGFASVGKNVQISDRASFYGVGRISLGSNVRIDDFCVLSAGVGGISVGNYVHIAVYSSLIGAGKISLSDYCNISSRVAIYSSNDDYSGAAMTNPTVPSEFTGVTHADVLLGKHVIVGSGSVILPGVTLEEGVAVGALSLVQKCCQAFGVYAGNPARRIKERKRDLLELEQRLISRGI